MIDPAPKQIAELLAIRLLATAELQFQMATALVGKGQDELRKHFASSADIMIEAAQTIKELSHA